MYIYTLVVVFKMCEALTGRLDSEWFRIRRLTDPLWQFIEAKETQAALLLPLPLPPLLLLLFTTHARPTDQPTDSVTSQKGGGGFSCDTQQELKERERDRKKERGKKDENEKQNR